VGHVSQVAKVGDYFVQAFAGESIVVIRESPEKISGFLNVCRHRGHPLCSAESGNLRRFVCPYHYWSYGIDGALKHTPGSPDGACFDYKDWPLRRVHVEAFHGFLFAFLDDCEPPKVAQKFAAVSAELESFATEDLKEIHRESYDIQSNWKTLLENYLECYHCQGSHPTLSKSMDLEAMYAGTDEWQDPYFVGSLPLKTGLATVSLNGELVSKPLGSFQERTDVPAGSGTGFGVVPVLSRIIVHVDHAVTHALRPIDVGRVKWETRWYVRSDAVDGVDYDLEKVVAVWRATNGEDIALCEAAYRGVLSRSFVPGPLHDKRESAIPAALRTYMEMMKAG
jgi:Rieske 2Fe-2S family protein